MLVATSTVYQYRGVPELIAKLQKNVELHNQKKVLFLSKDGL
jgi:hypothetical protein